MESPLNLLIFNQRTAQVLKEPDRKPGETVLVLVNPISGTGSKKGIPERIRKDLSGMGYDPVVYFTEGKGHAGSLVKDHLARGIEKVVAVGGDGTVNEVATALVHTSAVLGIVPMGSGNGLARHLGLPFGIGQSLDLLQQGKTLGMDYGTINGIPFFCTAGVGFDAYVGKLFSEAMTRGFGVYLTKTVQALFQYHPGHYVLEVGDQRIETDAFVVTFANASQYGNRATIAPGADLTDGKMDLVIVSPFPLVMAPALGIQLFTRLIDRSRYVQVIRCEEAKVIAPSGEIFIHYDGESDTTERLVETRVVRNGLRVLVP